MTTLEKDGVLVIRKNKEIVGFVHLNLTDSSKERAPVFYKSVKMGFDDLIDLHSNGEIIDPTRVYKEEVV